MRTLSFLLCAVLGVGCSSGTSGQASSDPASAYTSSDGQTIFRGVYFADGPAASLSNHWDVQSSDSSADTTSPAYTAATLQNLAAAYANVGWTTVATDLDVMADQLRAGTVSEVNASAELRSKNVDLLLDLINNGDSTFFDRFKSEITSGDDVQVSDAIQEGTRRVVAAIALVGAANTRATVKSRRAPSLHGDDLVSGGSTLVNGGSGSLVDAGSGSLVSDGGSLVTGMNTGLVSSNGDSTGADPDSMQMPQQQAGLVFNVQITHDSVAVTDKIAVLNAALFWATPDGDGKLGTAAYVHQLSTALAKKP